MSDEMVNKISQNALRPKAASGDAGSVEQHSIPDQIAAAKFVASSAAVKRRGFGLRMAKINPGGCE